MLVDHSGVQGGLRQIPLPRSGSDVAGRRAPAVAPAASVWVRRYSLALGVMEALFAAVAAGGTLLVRNGVDPANASFWAAAALVVAWPALLVGAGAHSERIFGTGSDEYRVVGRAGFALLA